MDVWTDTQEYKAFKVMFKNLKSAYFLEKLFTYNNWGVLDSYTQYILILIV